MKRTSWLKKFWQSGSTGKGRRRLGTPSLEILEQRSLPSVTALFIPGTGELNIQIDTDESIQVQSIGGTVFVTAGEPGQPLLPVEGLGSVSSANIRSLVVIGGDEANTIDLSTVTTTNFPLLTSIQVDADNGNDTIIGSPDLGDSLDGGDGNDTIQGQGGIDTLDGGDGDDLVDGSAGNDSISGGDGQDSILGQDGNDLIDSGDGDDTVSGGLGDDNIRADNGEDVLNGDEGNDLINGDGGADTINGDDGDDSILGGEFGDSLFGGLGNDTINGQAGNDTVDAGEGNDSVIGGVGNDSLSGNLGNDTLNGAAGNDQIIGDDGNDSLIGGAGNDFLFGLLGDDTARGQAGDDTVWGGGGVDLLDGGAGNDSMNSFLLPEIRVADLTILEGTLGTQTAMVAVSISAPTIVAVTVQLTTADNIAEAGTDFLPVTTTVTIPAGQTVGRASIDIVTDSIYEGDESFIVNISTPTNGVILDSQGFVTLLNDDSTAAQQLVYVDFDTSTSAGDHLYNALERNMIMSRLAAMYAGFPVQFTQVRPVVGAFNTITVNEPPPGGLASEVDFRNVNLTASATVDINGFLGQIGDPPATSQNFVELTAKVIAHENGHLLGLRHGDAYGPLGSGIAPIPGPGSYLPGYPGPVTAFESTRHIMGSPASNGETLFDAISNQFFGEREAVKLSAWAFGGSVIAEQSSSHSSVNSAQPIQFDELFVPNTLRLGTNLNRTFRVHEATVTGEISFAGEIDVYSFAGTTGQLLNFEVISSILDRYSNTIDSVIRVLDTNGNVIPYYTSTATNDDEFESFDSILIDLVLPSTGTFFVEVSALSAFDTGSYELFGYDFATYLPLLNTGNNGVLTIPADLGDFFLGGEGNDDLQGADGDDTLNGQAGNDSILGGFGNDSLLGGNGNDTLDGQAGSDTLNGQTGNDSVLGGDNDDLIVFDGSNPGSDFVDGGQGLNTIQANGTSLADTLTITGTGGVINVGIGTGTISATTNVQSVIVDARGGDDAITLSNLSNLGFSKLDVRGGTGNDLLDATGTNLGLLRLSLNGNEGNDTINGSLDAESLIGGSGNDSLFGSAGNDTMLGEAGNDVIGGGHGNDFIDGGAADDVINGTQGDDSLLGGLGNDTLKGDDGADTMNGGQGDDNLNGMAGDDSLLGSVGADILAGGIGNDTLDGGRNDDTIAGNSGDDRIHGDHGNDVINGGTGSDTVNGGDGDDIISTLDGGDIIVGGDGNDRINTSGGDDLIDAGDGNDTVAGGGGNDTILGGDGDDVLNGQGGSDAIAGQQGNDTIIDGLGETFEQFTLSPELLAVLAAS